MINAVIMPKPGSSLVPDRKTVENQLHTLVTYAPCRMDGRIDKLAVLREIANFVNGQYVQGGEETVFRVFMEAVEAGDEYRRLDAGGDAGFEDLGDGIYAAANLMDRFEAVEREYDEAINKLLALMGVPAEAPEPKAARPEPEKEAARPERKAA